LIVGYRIQVFLPYGGVRCGCEMRGKGRGEKAQRKAKMLKSVGSDFHGPSSLKQGKRTAQTDS
jgi:hypothetical protein